MSNLIEKLQQRRSAIRDVLLKEWDPIGVAQFAEAQDEYDHYVAEADVLVFGNASADEIFDYLWKIETESMGLPGNRPKTELIARRLLEMRKQEPQR
jgi:hypothetical protein